MNSDIQFAINYGFSLMKGMHDRIEDIAQITAYNEWRNLLNDKKYDYEETGRLHRFGYKVFSMNEQDGIIDAIFNLIGEKSRTFIEFGAGEGTNNNTMFLLMMKNWKGLWIENNVECYKKLKENFSHHLDTNQLNIVNEFVTKRNINPLIYDYLKLFDRLDRDDVDFLSIDIDGNDYYIWEAIDCCKPRVVCIEYNSHIPPDISVTVPYNDSIRWSGGNYYGASLRALHRLAEEKGYRLVCCNITGADAFFVREDLYDTDCFSTNTTPSFHYESPRFKMVFNTGHPSKPGIWLEK